jgi:hypothetical protein
MVDLTDTASNGSNYSYNVLYSRCSELCRAADHDKTAMIVVVSLVDEATERLRMGFHISPTWTDIPNKNNTDNVPPQRLPTIRAHHTRPTEQFRFKSSNEVHRQRKRKVGNVVGHPLPNTG